MAKSAFFIVIIRDILATTKQHRIFSVCGNPFMNYHTITH